MGFLYRVIHETLILGGLMIKTLEVTDFITKKYTFIENILFFLFSSFI